MYRIMSVLLITVMMLGTFAPLAQAAVDRVAPELTVVSPPQNAVEVPLNTNITLAFDETVAAAVYFAGITVTGGGSVVEYTYSFTGDTLYLDPVNNLAAHTVYTIEVPAGAVQDQSGNEFNPTASWQFTTGESLLIMAASATGIYNIQPGNRAFTFEQKPLISANFTGISIAKAEIILEGQPVITQEYSPPVTGGEIAFTPLANLNYGEHDVAVKITDSAGNSKSATWYFTVNDRLGANPSFYFGIPHSHTGYSDGMETPACMFSYAYNSSQHYYDKPGIDWVMSTEHSCWLDGASFNAATKEHSAGNPSECEWTWVQQEAQAFNNGQPNFLAVRGFEMSPDWGHINVYGTDKFVEKNNMSSGMTEFYQWLTAQDSDRVEATFNHPSWPADSFSDLQYCPDVDRVINTLEVGNGWAPYFYKNAEPWYYWALDLGWHIGAVNGQDNHTRNWGRPDNLTGIVLDGELTEAALLEAYRERRVFSTETRDLKLTFKTDDGHWMGSVLDVPVGETLQFAVVAEDHDHRIKKLELVTNEGRVIDEENWLVGTGKATWTPDPVTPVPGERHWYLVRVTHVGGEQGFSSPIFTTGALQALDNAVPPRLRNAGGGAFDGRDGLKDIDKWLRDNPNFGEGYKSIRKYLFLGGLQVICPFETIVAHAQSGRLWTEIANWWESATGQVLNWLRDWLRDWLGDWLNSGFISVSAQASAQELPDDVLNRINRQALLDMTNNMEHPEAAIIASAAKAVVVFNPHALLLTEEVHNAGKDAVVVTDIKTVAGDPFLNGQKVQRTYELNIGVQPNATSDTSRVAIKSRFDAPVVVHLDLEDLALTPEQANRLTIYHQHQAGGEWVEVPGNVYSPENKTLTFAVDQFSKFAVVVGDVKMFGDPTGDANITAADATLALRAAVNLEQLTGEQIELADVNGDRQVTASDATLILRRAVNLIDQFPVNK